MFLPYLVMPYTEHRLLGVAEMRPYLKGEDLEAQRVSVSPEDTPEEGGMVARNPHNHEDKWYVAKEYFLQNFEPLLAQHAFTKEQKQTDPVLRYFGYQHLREKEMQRISQIFHDAAVQIIERIPRSPERTVGLRKLLEAKDCIVRSSLPEEE